MTVMSGSLPLDSKYIKIRLEEEGFQAFLTQPPLVFVCPAVYTLFFYKNIVFPAQAEYSYFSADFRLKIFLNYS